MSTGEILFAVASGLAINEMCDLSPWLAKKLVRWAARHLYRDPGRAEELSAMIDDRPGKLFKLLTALGFAVAAITHQARTHQTGPTRLVDPVLYRLLVVAAVGDFGPGTSVLSATVHLPWYVGMLLGFSLVIAMIAAPVATRHRVATRVTFAVLALAWFAFWPLPSWSSLWTLVPMALAVWTTSTAVCIFCGRVGFLRLVGILIAVQIGLALSAPMVSWPPGNGLLIGSLAGCTLGSFLVGTRRLLSELVDQRVSPEQPPADTGAG